MATRRTSDGPRTPAAVVHEPGVEAVTVTATTAQTEFGRILDSTSYGRVVVITKHNEPRAVLLSIDRYRALTDERAPNLAKLRAEWDAEFEYMQTPEWTAGMRRAWNATPEELGQAAVLGAQRDKAERDARAREATARDSRRREVEP